MKDIKIFKSAFPKREDVQITIHEEFQEGLDMETTKVLQDLDAVRMAQALYETLPGGTFDRLLAHMMVRASSCLGVSHKSEDLVIEQTADFAEVCRRTAEYVQDLPFEWQSPSILLQLKNVIKSAEG